MRLSTVHLILAVLWLAQSMGHYYLSQKQLALAQQQLEWARRGGR